MAKKMTVKKQAKKLTLSPLEFALGMETQGVGMYLKLAVRTSNALGKKLFYSLAGEEIDHARKIDTIVSGISSSAGWESVKERTLPSVSVTLKNFFTKNSHLNLKKDQGNLEGYRIAMEMEKESYAAYENYYRGAKTEAEKGFFRELLAQEKEHLDALTNVYSYLTDTEDWLQENESKVWNWMNL